ncbi:MAG: tyrosine-type recombinase/integrase [Pseudomonadota bacterium]|nr:tyrosine-type recombinase/integrase [Pseudomonadota bacterium]
MNALGFLYKRVLNHTLEGRINAVRAKKINVPVVVTREEVAAVISLLDGTAQLVAKLLYGSGLRIMEAVRIRVKDIDFQMEQLTVRSGKGDKDRFTTFSRHAQAFVPGISPWTLVLASPVAIMLTPASSTRRSRWRCAVPV